MLQPLASEVQPRSGDEQLSCVQLTGLHVAPVAQATSHAQDGPQRTSRHDSLALQPILHGPEPQVTPWQLRKPLQVTAHEVPLGQVTPLRHELSVLHLMSHL